MWPTRRKTAERLVASLRDFSAARRPLPGVACNDARETLAMQMVASLRRLDHTKIMLDRTRDPDRANPNSDMFDPERAAILHARAGRIDEAVWLVFLATHFGKHPRWGWQRVRDVYSGLGDGIWTWDRVSRSPAQFRAWLIARRSEIGGAFGNHRKYESLNGNGSKGTGAVVESYLHWVGPHRSQAHRFAELVQAGGNHPHAIFDHFYNEMVVARFGRLGKFDFLSMLGRLNLAPIVPGSAYLHGATGPLRGARLLFGGDPEARLGEAVLEEWLQELDSVLQVGMQVVEDSLCNWQKSPKCFVHFRG